MTAGVAAPGARPHSVPFHVTAIGEEEIAAVVATLRSGWLTTEIGRAHV